MRTSFYLFLSFLVVSSGCSKEQPKPSPLNEDCSCAEETNADFVIEELSTAVIDGFFTETDTTFENKNIRFTALQENAEYTWYLGAEVLTDKSFLRYFDNTTANSNIPVSLVVRKKPNLICFPEDDGYDSITKVLTIVPVDQIINGTFYMEGLYRFKSPHLTDSVDIYLEFHYNHPEFFSGGRSVMIYNWDGQGAVCEGNFGGGIGILPLNYREFKTQEATNCGNVSLHMFRDMSDAYELNVRYREANEFKTYNYKGRKL